MQRGQQAGGDPAARLRRREHRHLGAAGDPGQEGRHEHGGDEGHVPPRHVEADPADRVEFFTHLRTLRIAGHPAGRNGASVEGDDAVPRGRKRPALGGGEAPGGGRQLGRRHPKITGAQAGPVEFGGIAGHRRVAARLDPGQDVRHRRRHPGRHRRGPAERIQLGRKILGAEREAGHG